MAIGEVNVLEKYARAPVILLDGVAKVGKTTTALSVSAKCPDVLPSKTRIVLDDICCISHETDAFDGAVSAGLVPGYVYDMSSLALDAHAVKGDANARIMFLDNTLRTMRTTVTARLEGKRALVIDGLTTFAAQVENILQGVSDNVFWGLLARYVTEYMTWASGLNKPVVATCHVRPESVFRGKANDAEAKAAHEASLEARSVGDGELIPSLGSGFKNSSWWINNASAVWPVVNGSAGKRILPYGGGGYQGGCRYLGLDKNGEVANLNLLLKKLQNTGAK